MKTRSWFAAIVAMVGVMITGSAISNAVSTSTVHVHMQINMTEAAVDGLAQSMPIAPLLIEDKLFIPAKFLGDALDVRVAWNSVTGKVEMNPKGVRIEFDIANHMVSINDYRVPFDQIAVIRDDILMLKLSWLADYLGASYAYDEKQGSIDLTFIKDPGELYDIKRQNSRPSAKFTFAKPSYRIGEPVRYVDLSYDPDAEGIANWQWTGKEDVFFKAGKYPISLIVKDAKGNVSDVYTRELIIEDKPFLNELNYKLQFLPVGSLIPTDWSTIYAHFYNLTSLPKKVVEDRSRTLIVSDSPESIKEKGILYQEIVTGKARLYADHVNESVENVQFSILARNTGTKPVTIRTTNKGEVFPSIYAHLIGHEASVDFMLHDLYNEQVIVPPGQIYTYVRMPNFYPGQGVNVFYDVETDGEIEFSFVATANLSYTPILKLLTPLPFVGNVRGTFPVANVRWDVDVSDLTIARKLTIGDGEEDPFVKGFDRQRNQEVANEGNYGMMYNIHIDKPGKMAVLLLARGGPFKGPFKINGEFVMVPQSGVLPAFEKVQIIGRTDGTEEALDIEFTPPAGSAFPIDVIFYPLDQLEGR